ncbi:hypothetical protein AYI70_g9078 [Smittium culicis]|uniref:Uncharacterized protein n=1 Tax=Smittium culicis TaxID=133412 RepID=A0A1R1XCZ8_9FUNG|nr:hypothetical protein AYI70_g9078 [Smittium culicis]
MDHTVSSYYVWIFFKHKSDETFSISSHRRTAIGAHTDAVFPLQMKIQNFFVHQIKNVLSFHRALQFVTKKEFIPKFSAFDEANESQELSFYAYIGRFINLERPQQHRFVFKIF